MLQIVANQKVFVKSETWTSLKSNGDTPIHLAAEKGRFEIVRELVRRGSRVDPYNHDRKRF